MQFVMTRVGLHLKLVFYRKYRECVIAGEPKLEFSLEEGNCSIIVVHPGEYYT